MEVELEVVGRHAMFFDDDATAAFVNSEDALIEWNSLSIDRFDVRNLLSNPPSSFRKLSSQGGSLPDSHLESELDLERYADLPSSNEPGLCIFLFFFYDFSPKSVFLNNLFLFSRIM